MSGITDIILNDDAKAALNAVVAQAQSSWLPSKAAQQGKSPNTSDAAMGFAYSQQQPFEHDDPMAIEAACRQALEEIDKVLSELNPVPSALQNKRDGLATLTSVKEINAHRADLVKRIQHAIDYQDLDKNMTSVELMQNATQAALQAELNKLWTDFHKCEKAIEDEFEKFYRRGYITQDQWDYLKAERARLDALPEGSEARIAGEQKFAETKTEWGLDVSRAADRRGDHTTKQDADKVVHQEGEQKDNLEKQREVHRQMHRQEDKGHYDEHDTKSARHGMRVSEDDEPSANTVKEKPRMAVAHDVTQNDRESTYRGMRVSEDDEPAANTTKEKPRMAVAHDVTQNDRESTYRGMRVSEDDEPAANTTKEKPRMAVAHDVTQNDIEAPDGGKNRSTHRKITKT